VSSNHPILLYETQLREAQLAGDVNALDRLIDDALIFTTLEGTVVGKTDDLDLHRSGQLRITRMNPIEHHIVDLGTTVVVAVKMDAEASVDGAVFSGKLRYTRVWCERPGGWRVVAGHMSVVQG
jgi:ketosteroid isomerase-like protein